MMFLNNLALQNFRNYHTLQLKFSPQVNVLVGQNAQGKTNLLEAVALLCLGKSFRTKKENELIHWGEDFFYIKGDFTDQTLLHQVEIGLGAEKKKIKINGQAVKTFDFFSQVPVVIFSPDDLQLIKGGPQLRRDFLDLYLAQVAPKYRYVYLDYLKVLQQRNRFLKEKNGDRVEMEVWNDQLLERGIKVITYRSNFVEQIRPYILEAHQRVCGSCEQLKLDYLCMGKYLNPQPEESEIRQLMSSELKRVAKMELERRMTLVGPQRDDLVLALNSEFELRSFGSQGQQRTAALALKLGLIEVIKVLRETTPLLLLDDVMSEFDDRRKQLLLSMLLHSTQTFVTATSRNDFPGLSEESEAVFFTVQEGVVSYGNQLLCSNC